MKIKILDLLGLQLSRCYQGLRQYFYENGKHYFWIKRRLTKRINVSFSAVFTSSSTSKLFDLKNANSHQKESFCNCVSTKVCKKRVQRVPKHYSHLQIFPIYLDGMFLKVIQCQKQFFFFNSFKKRSKNFCPATQGKFLKIFCSFFGRIEAKKNCF